MCTMAIIHENPSKYLFICLDFCIYHLIIQIVINRMGTVIHPRKQRPTNYAVIPLELLFDLLLQNPTKEFEIIFNDPSHSIPKSNL